MRHSRLAGAEAEGCYAARPQTRETVAVAFARTAATGSQPPDTRTESNL